MARRFTRRFEAAQLVRMYRSDVQALASAEPALRSATLRFFGYLWGADRSRPVVRAMLVAMLVRFALRVAAAGAKDYDLVHRPTFDRLLNEAPMSEAARHEARGAHDDALADLSDPKFDHVPELTGQEAMSWKF